MLKYLLKGNELPYKANYKYSAAVATATTGILMAITAFYPIDPGVQTFIINGTVFLVGLFSAYVQVASSKSTGV